MNICWLWPLQIIIYSHLAVKLLKLTRCLNIHSVSVDIIKTYYIRNHDINDCVTLTHHVCKLST
jgi:hypothetical protein